MKKLFTLAAAVLFAMGMSAQSSELATFISVEGNCNYIDFQKDGDKSVNPPATSTAPMTLSNGTVIKGFLKSDNTESEIAWNVKDSYGMEIPMPDLCGTGTNPATDSTYMKVGSMLKIASNCSLELGAFVCTGGKVRIYFQPNGDSDRGVSVSVKGGTPVEILKSGKKNGHKMRPGYIAEVDLPAGNYLAGDVVIKVSVNTINIFGIEIQGLYTTGIQETMAEAGVRYNGNVILNEARREMSVFNALGKMVASTSEDFNMSQMPAGVYVVRVAGVKGALKIRK
ncbi:MAG: T9SS type A sorting domain-containing protein [Paludibacteraceae bacterium]|nr:T9SS type A sorting domain-containing protein [Paludibacteraceae bacterium]